MIDKEKLLGWLYGLIGASFNGGINTIGVLFIAPESFNFSNEGLKKLLELFAVGAIAGCYLYCKQSPLKISDKDEQKEKEKALSEVN